MFEKKRNSTVFLIHLAEASAIVLLAIGLVALATEAKLSQYLSKEVARHSFSKSTKMANERVQIALAAPGRDVSSYCRAKTPSWLRSQSQETIPRKLSPALRSHQFRSPPTSLKNPVAES